MAKNPPANAGATGKNPLEEKMATRSSILASKILWTEECDRLQSMGLQRIGYN